MKQGVRQDAVCLQNVCYDDLIGESKKLRNDSDIEISRNSCLNRMFFTDVQVMIKDIEQHHSYLSINSYQLNLFYVMKLRQKRKSDLCDNYSIRTSIVANNTILEQVTHFQHLGCDL